MIEKLKIPFDQYKLQGKINEIIDWINNFQELCKLAKVTNEDLSPESTVPNDKEGASTDSRKGCGKIIQVKRYRTTCGTVRFGKLHLCESCKGAGE